MSSSYQLGLWKQDNCLVQGAFSCDYLIVLCAAVALNYFAYNFIKIHRTLRVSPAMAAGVTDRLWSVKDLVTLWESYEQWRAERAA
jgi:hypothetical protein